MAREQLDWHPRINLDTAFDWKFEWRHDHAAGEHVGKLTEEQISRFQDRLSR